MNQEKHDDDERDRVTPNGAHDEDDIKSAEFERYIRRMAQAAYPLTPDEMLPWLVGKMAAQGAHLERQEKESQRRFERIEADLDIVKAAVVDDKGASRLDPVEEKLASVDKRAPTRLQKDGTLLLVLAFAIMWIVKIVFGIDLPPPPGF